jgi:ammonium transporter Rh
VVFLGVTSGAVAVSSIAGLMLHPAGALLTGIFSSIVTCIAFYNLSVSFYYLIHKLIATLSFATEQLFFQPFLSRKLRLHDCFHVVPSFCLPIITSGILSSIYSLLADEKDYGVTLYEVFPARSPKSNSSELEEILWMLSRIEPGLGRTAGEQAVYQLIALSTIVSIALVSGVVSGVVIRHPMFDHLKKKEMFDDSGHWTTGNLEVVMTGGESNCELDNSNAGDQVETLQIPSLKRIRTKLNA